MAPPSQPASAAVLRSRLLSPAAPLSACSPWQSRLVQPCRRLQSRTQDLSCTSAPDECSRASGPGYRRLPAVAAPVRTALTVQLHGTPTLRDQQGHRPAMQGQGPRACWQSTCWTLPAGWAGVWAPPPASAAYTSQRPAEAADKSSHAARIHACAGGAWEAPSRDSRSAEDAVGEVDGGAWHAVHSAWQKGGHAVHREGLRQDLQQPSSGLQLLAKLWGGQPLSWAGLHRTA